MDDGVVWMIRLRNKEGLVYEEFCIYLCRIYLKFKGNNCKD